MAVTVTTNTLSSRVRYLNVSASTANTDAKDVILAMANALVDLGWSRYDTAGATAVVGSDDNAGVILRRQCYDFDQSGHYNYLGLRLVGSGTDTYTFYLTQAADWTGTTSMSSFVAGAASSLWASNVTGRTNLLDFAQGGTIWLFDSGKTLLLTSQSGTTLTKTDTAIWIVGEYKKEFGENVDAATGYIHNGLLTSSSWFLDASGQNPLGRGHLGLKNINNSIGVVSSGNSSATYAYDFFSTVRYKVSNSSGSGSISYTFAGGNRGPQFLLTEAPTAAATTDLFSNLPSAPAACTGSFSTRMSMGYLGYVGYVNPYYSHSVNTIMGISTVNPGPVYNNIVAMPFSTYNSTTQYTISSYLLEYANNNLDGGLKFNIFEPILSTGTTSPLNDTAGTSYFGGGFENSPVTGTYTGPQYKFSMLGRPFDVKIFGPYTNEKYSFLDAITIPCDADGFYTEGGTDKDFWLIPSGVNVAYVMPK